MSSKLSYKELTLEILKQSDRPLSVNEIWQKALEKGLDKKLSSIGQTPTQTIWNRLLTDKINFLKTSIKPTTFWLKERENELLKLDNKNEITNEKQEKNKFHERDLHPLLVKFLYENLDFNLNCKTIYHEQSKKGKGGEDKWNYPDIVGVYFPYDDYEKETITLLENIKQNSYKLFSFELKIALNFSNLKECYFQALSNSSWANEGYLVVLQEIDSEVLSELRRLNQSFGIGVIKLDIQTLNMLINKNPNFKEFIDDINKQIKVGKEAKIQANFDEIKSDEEMEKYLKEKCILEK
ncbi:HTH domain-containing protein [Campylobacter jejuni]|uniref:HTH domain-containing protein n=1 Tax=Campylobacter jejuni TaxID=197 RepID=UPI000C29197E|nr:HTH domain-containing protein [Campylobacter jejuni]ECR1995645.1 HrgA protein [Campylobacter jejuni]EDP6955503.1 HrgA protein [Campylobacter jejuni]PJP65583.1 HrgA protein [Campylobacter jejuni subsp. jejuni]PJQ06624.1 HrgA protein [Campylobacter jejuni subsp. jejuni]